MKKRNVTAKHLPITTQSKTKTFKQYNNPETTACDHTHTHTMSVSSITDGHNTPFATPSVLSPLVHLCKLIKPGIR